MTATLVITLPDGTTRTLELSNISIQTTYSTEFVSQTQAEFPLQSMVPRVNLTGAIVSGSLAG